MKEDRKTKVSTPFSKEVTSYFFTFIASANRTALFFFVVAVVVVVFWGGVVFCFLV